MRVDAYIAFLDSAIQMSILVYVFRSMGRSCESIVECFLEEDGKQNHFRVPFVMVRKIHETSWIFRWNIAGLGHRLNWLSVALNQVRAARSHTIKCRVQLGNERFYVIFYRPADEEDFTWEKTASNTFNSWIDNFSVFPRLIIVRQLTRAAPSISPIRQSEEYNLLLLLSTLCTRNGTHTSYTQVCEDTRNFFFEYTHPPA